MKKNVNKENLLKEINEITHIGGWELNLENMMPIWSAEVRYIHEVSDDYQPTLETAINFYKPEARPVIKAAVEKSLVDGSHWDLELPIVTAKGRNKWIRTTGRAEFKNGKPVKLFGAFQDITAHKLEEEQILLSEQKFKNAFTYLGTGMALVSVEGKWLDVNPVISKILGYAPEELFSMTFQDITHPDDLQNDLKHLHELVDGKIDSYEIEKRYFHKNNAIVWALLTVSLVRHQDGTPLYFISQIQDITQRKLMENALIENNEMLKALANQLTHQNKLLEEFNHIVSHNLRTPAGNIALLLQFYEEAETDEERRELIEQINSSSVNLLAILNDLVDVLRVKGGKHIETDTLFFEQVLKKTMDMLSGNIREKGAEITFDFNIPSVNYSRIYLESAMLNLLSNALKYSFPNRRPLIQFKTYLENNKVMMSVTDNGTGIDMEKYADRIFNLHQTFHRNNDAKGLGLYMTKNQLESLGGSISVESVENEGTTFYIQF